MNINDIIKCIICGLTGAVVLNFFLCVKDPLFSDTIFEGYCWSFCLMMKLIVYMVVLLYIHCYSRSLKKYVSIIIFETILLCWIFF